MEESSNQDEPDYKEFTFNFHFDDQEQSPYTNIPSQKNPSYDPHQEVADLDSYSYYTR